MRHYKQYSVNFTRMLLLLTSLSIFSYVNADMTMYQNSCHTQCCNEPPTCDWSYNPPGHQKCGNNSCGGFLDNLTGRVDFLWWRPCSEGTALGYTEVFGISGTSSTTVSSDQTHNKDLNFKFDPGFRLGLGYYCPSNCIDVALVWTHFHSKARAFGSSDIIDATDTSSELFYSNWITPFNLFPEEQEARWSLDMDLLDLEFAQKYYVNHCFILRPFVALRAVRIDQNYHVEGYSNDSLFVESFTSEVKAKNDFRGIGPRIGLDLEIKLGCGVSLFGKGAASLVFGKFERNTTQVGTSVLIGPQIPKDIDLTYEAKGNEDRCTVPMTEISIGLLWEHCLCCCNKSYPFALAIAWEANAFYDLNHFNFQEGVYGKSISPIHTVNGQEPKTGNLTTQGLTISAMIGF